MATTVRSQSGVSAPPDGSVTNVKVASDAGIDLAKTADSTTSTGRLALTSAERTKIAGVATGATANSTDAALRARSSHTGTQSADTLTDGTSKVAMTTAERAQLAALPPAVVVLDADAAVPSGLADGTVVLRRAAGTTGGGTPTTVTETWTGSNGATWPAAWTYVGATVDIQSNRGRLVTAASAYAISSAFRTGSGSANEEILVKWQTNGTTERYLTVAARTQDDANYYGVQFYPTNTMSLFKKVASADTTLGTATPITWAANTDYWLRFRLSGTSLSAKVWADGGSEPGSFQVTATDSAITAAGTIFLWVGAGAAGTAVTASFDDLTVTPL